MISILAVATAGLLAAGGSQLLWRRNRSPQTLIGSLIIPEEVKGVIEPPHPPVQTTLMHVTESLTKLDERYQRTLQQGIDRLVSGTRHAQWQEITGSIVDPNVKTRKS